MTSRDKIISLVNIAGSWFAFARSKKKPKKIPIELIEDTNLFLLDNLDLTLYFMNFSLYLDFEKFKAEQNILCLTQNKQGMFKIQEVPKHEGYLFEGWHFVQTYFKPLKSF